RRALRIFPVYYLTLIASLLGEILLGSHSSWLRNNSPTPTGWVTYFIYLQNWWVPLKEWSRMGLLGHLWSLAVEEQFYFVWPWIVWRVPAKRLPAICGFGFVLAFIIRLVCM